MNIADFLKQEKVKFELLLHHDTYDAQHMAQSLHIGGRHVAKTVLLRTDGGSSFIVAVLPATCSIDFELASRMLGSRVELASEREIAENCPDCEIGALPPFGRQFGMKTMVDESLVEDEDIVFEGNTHHEAIRMKFRDFQHIEEPLVGSFTSAASSMA